MRVRRSSAVRRNVGYVALVVALAVTILWCRSYLVRDEIWIPRPNRLHLFDSSHGGIQWERHSSANRIEGNHWISRNLDRSDVLMPVALDGDVYWAFAGFCYQSGHFQLFNEPYEIWRIPYWSVVLPLTLLSAYLIFWKARTMEPTA